MGWIERGLELCEKATPGPWIDSAGDVEKDEGNYRGDRALFDACINASKDDTQFIVDARTNYPQALNWISRAKPILEAYLEGLSSEVRPDDSEVYPEECKELRELLSELEGE